MSVASILILGVVSLLPSTGPAHPPARGRIDRAAACLREADRPSPFAACSLGIASVDVEEDGPSDDGLPGHDLVGYPADTPRLRVARPTRPRPSPRLRPPSRPLRC